MSSQGHLFSGIQSALNAPIVRSSDPRPSHLAAKQVTASGKRESQLKIVLSTVQEWPNRTAAELAQLSKKFDRYVANRRLPELERGGLVQRAAIRNCSVTGNASTTWEAIQ